jgi:O-antigen/teichoic acid export membrane protein
MNTEPRLDQDTPTRSGVFILRDAVWLASAQSCAGIAQFGAFVLLARRLGPATYGHWTFAAAFVALFAAAADFGLSTLAVRDLSRDRYRVARYLGTSAVIKVAVSLGIFAAIAGIGPLVAGDPETLTLVFILGAQMLIASAIVFVNSVLRVHQRMNIEAAIRTTQGVATFVVMGALVLSGADVVMAALGYLVVTGGTLVVSTVVTLRWFVREPLRVHPQLLRPLLSQAAPLAVAMMMTALYYYFDVFYMGLLGQDEAVGWYGAAYAPVLWIAQTVTAVRTAFLPGQARVHASGDDANFLSFYAWTSAAFAFPVVAGGIIIAGPLLHTVYGAAYEPATFALRVLFVTAGVMFFSSFFGSQLLVAGRQRAYLSAVTAGAASNIVLTIALVGPFSLDGAAVATLSSELLVCAVLMWHCRSSFAIGRLMDGARHPGLAALGLVAVLICARYFVPIPLAAALAAAAYLALVWRGLPVARQALAQRSIEPHIGTPITTARGGRI